jgi:hypothetical protein
MIFFFDIKSNSFTLSLLNFLITHFLYYLNVIIHFMVIYLYIKNLFYLRINLLRNFFIFMAFSNVTFSLNIVSVMNLISYVKLIMVKSLIHLSIFVNYSKD